MSEKKEAEVPNGQILVQSQVKLLIKRTSSEISEKEVEKIFTICFQYLFKETSRKKLGKKIDQLRREAIVVTRLLLEVLVEFPERKVQLGKYEDNINLIFAASGVIELNSWISKQGSNGDEIVESSGHKKILDTIVNFRLHNDKVPFFNSLKSLRKTVSDLYEWLKIVKALNVQRRNGFQLTKMAYASGTQMIWNKDRVYLSLIVGLTLDTAQVVFKLSDILLFCEKIRMKEWNEQIQEKLNQIVIEDSVKGTLYHQPTIQNLLEDLQKTQNQTIFYFGRKVALVPGDSKVLLSFSSAILSAARIISETKSQSRSQAKAMQELKKRVGIRLGNFPATVAHQLLVEYPHLIELLDQQQIFRLAIVDAETHSLSRLIKGYSGEEYFLTATAKLQESVTVGDVLNSIIQGDDLFGFKFDFFTKNRSIAGRQKKNLSTTNETKLYSSVLNSLTTTLPPTQLNEYLLRVEKVSGNSVNLKGIRSTRLVACFFASSKDERPKAITDRVFHEPWAPYVDEYSQQYFNSILLSLIEVKKKGKSSIDLVHKEK